MTPTICPDCGTCTECVADDEHRGSRMPPHLPSLDADYLRQLLTVPKEALEEKEAQ